jgi:recombination protein RecT
MAVNNSLSTKNQRVGLTAYLTNDAVKNQINNVIGGKNGQRFISSIISAVQTNPALQECSNSSILSSALLGESLKLSPSPQLGHYYLVPFNDSKRGCKVAQFQMGYKGLLQLAIRSGQYKTINVVAIKEGELVKFDPLNEEIEVNLIEDELVRENTPTVGYYASFTYLNGFRKAIYWSRAKMEAHALKYSKGYKAKKGYTFWEKDFDAMAFKTMLRQLISKWGIMSIDMQTAIDSDMAVINEDGSRDYVDNYEETEEPAAETTAEIIEPEPTPAPATPADDDIAGALFGE